MDIEIFGYSKNALSEYFIAFKLRIKNKNHEVLDEFNSDIDFLCLKLMKLLLEGR